MSLPATINYLPSWANATDPSDVPRLAKTHLPVFQETKSNSELSAWLACQVRHFYSYVLRKRSRLANEALDFGTLWHLGMAAWWKPNLTAQERFSDAVDAMTSDDVDPFMLVTLTELMRGYTARWCDAPYVALAIEIEGAMPLINPDTGEAHPTIGLMGVLDKIVSDGRLHVMEHKTTGSDIESGSSYWDRVRTLDAQVSTYLDLARTLGFDVEDVIYDVVRKPTIKPLKATPEEKRKYTKPTKKDPEPRLYANQRLADETPEEYGARVRADILENPGDYFARGPIVRLEADELRHRRDTWHAIRQMADVERAGWRVHNRFACGDFGGCEFRAVCEGRASIADEMQFVTKTPRMQLNARGGG